MLSDGSSGIWVKVAVVAAAVWVFYSLSFVVDPGIETTLEATILRVAAMATGAVVIVGLGLGAQWLNDFFRERADRRA
jgi:hypothetical protein